MHSCKFEIRSRIDLRMKETQLVTDESQRQILLSLLADEETNQSVERQPKER